MLHLYHYPSSHVEKAYNFLIALLDPSQKFIMSNQQKGGGTDSNSNPLQIANPNGFLGLLTKCFK